jgi:hypothetical protein
VSKNKRSMKNSVIGNILKVVEKSRGRDASGIIAS